jgi:hypothetical protein
MEVQFNARNRAAWRDQRDSKIKRRFGPIDRTVGLHVARAGNRRLADEGTLPVEVEQITLSRT